MTRDRLLELAAEPDNNRCRKCGGSTGFICTPCRQYLIELKARMIASHGTGKPRARALIQE